MLSKFIERLLREENPNDDIVCIFFYSSEMELEISSRAQTFKTQDFRMRIFRLYNYSDSRAHVKDTLDFLDDMGDCEFYFGDRNYQFKNNKIIEVDESEMLVLC